MANTVPVIECNVCSERGRSYREINHSHWCLPNAHLDCNTTEIVMARRTFSVVPITKSVCIHGTDVSLSPHECEHCSIAIAERRCPEM